MKKQIMKKSQTFSIIALFGLAVQTLSKTTVSIIHAFPSGVSLENLAIDSSRNSILVTSNNTPSLYQINLSFHQHQNNSAKVIHTFPNATGLLGITKYAPDTFAVIVGSFSIAHIGQNTSFSVWSIKFLNTGYSHTAETNIQVHKIADIPGARMLNGMTSMDESSEAVLVGDSLAGRVYRLCTRSGEVKVVLEDDETMKPENHPGEQITLRSVALNGIRKVTITNDHDHGNRTYLYYSNSNKTTINRVLIDPLTGYSRGPFTTLTSNDGSLSPDDLAYNYDSGDVYFAGHMDDVVVKVDSDKKETVLAHVIAPSSLVFEEGEQSHILYCTTAGGPEFGAEREGGKLLSIQVELDYQSF